MIDKPSLNSEKYHFADFTRSSYRKFLKLAKTNYQFKLFTEENNSDGIVLWRHDVDYSPQSALKLAQIEFEEGIKSTYFVLLHSDFYNLLEPDNINCFKQILQLGHEIGVHFDCNFYDIKNEESLVKFLKLESDFLSSNFNVDIKVFSFHNPFAFELSCRKDNYAGLINTYSERFHSAIGYCSDSNGYWRYERLEDVLQNKKHKSLQVLTHPEWWQDEIMSPKQRVKRCIDGRSDKLEKMYDSFLKEHGRENIDW